MTEHTAQSTVLTFTSFATFSTLMPKQTFQSTLKKKKSILNAYILLPTAILFTSSKASYPIMNLSLPSLSLLLFF